MSGVRDRADAEIKAVEIAHGRSVSPRRGQRKGALGGVFDVFGDFVVCGNDDAPRVRQQRAKRGLGLVIISQSRSHENFRARLPMPNSENRGGTDL